MTLEQLILNVELQGNIYIKVFDYEKDEYTATIDHYDPSINLLEQYGQYRITYIYDSDDGVIIEVTND